ncbi:AAR069Wp [Eremothecium gossypii ATCC 10895]|uniref:AAR069Wp n=1 Tax=Eremothecium gossypii (strain ATCC 10895 / CBS 109.51 / FGSC 9923 / NRRL Y-1056) TaxID=284811 RepID=Q75EL0_EREGS|nr:AAR069Wp [Eremothecium gossypii ATCC 10895]AAS50434.2 AAR069Wp [Eremothecium gossypii ATCC 10895]
MLYKRTVYWLLSVLLLSDGISAEEYVITLKAPKTLSKLLAVKLGNRTLKQILDARIKQKFSFGKFEAITVDIPPFLADTLTENKWISHISLNEEYNLLGDEYAGEEDTGDDNGDEFENESDDDDGDDEDEEEEEEEDGDGEDGDDDDDTEEDDSRGPPRPEYPVAPPSPQRPVFPPEPETPIEVPDPEPEPPVEFPEPEEPIEKPGPKRPVNPPEDEEPYNPPEPEAPAEPQPDHPISPPESEQPSDPDTQPPNDPPSFDPQPDQPVERPDLDRPEPEKPGNDEPSEGAPEFPTNPEEPQPPSDSPETPEPSNPPESDPIVPSDPETPSDPEPEQPVDVPVPAPVTPPGPEEPTSTPDPDSPPDKEQRPDDFDQPRENPNDQQPSPNPDRPEPIRGIPAEPVAGAPGEGLHQYAIQVDAPRHLARTCRRTGLPFDPSGDKEYTFNYYYDEEHLGEGVNVYVLDSGIYKSHPEFDGRAHFGIDTTKEGPGDLNGHGTHVAGLVGSRTFGIAKKANIYEIKVMTVDGRGSTSNIIAGVEFAVKHCQQSGKRCVANMSLGGLSFGHSALDSAVEAAIEEGLVFVVAAGNSKERACWYSPAKVKTAITVGAFDDRSDIIASFSNYGKCVDIFAPGVAVASLSNSPSNTMRVLNGTSMSAPITAGVVAVLLDQGIEPHEVKDHLLSISTKGLFHKRRLVSSRTPDRALFTGVKREDDSFSTEKFPFVNEEAYLKFIGDDLKKVQGPSLFRKVLRSSLSKVI